ncbi:hypothetical protein PRIPAC_79559 [Pristionchus pacificus]|uniref:Uncharacterized protein n=1 Tax=Pristionchus pacificus TaxID=54126 RepID=A0A2A6BWP1_PRIPA|nr:hypothetical protein PRIPAC_79559 [Pristionchus pacificus]|eukprot:PDM70315.1 hypothetical protein PRIPAC_46561 [Pristionchus pacificus]
MESQCKQCEELRAELADAKAELARAKTKEGCMMISSRALPKPDGKTIDTLSISPTLSRRPAREQGYGQIAAFMDRPAPACDKKQ